MLARMQPMAWWPLRLSRPAVLAQVRNTPARPGMASVNGTFMRLRNSGSTELENKAELSMAAYSLVALRRLTTPLRATPPLAARPSDTKPAQEHPQVGGVFGRAPPLALSLHAPTPR